MLKGFLLKGYYSSLTEQKKRRLGGTREVSATLISCILDWVLANCDAVLCRLVSFLSAPRSRIKGTTFEYLVIMLMLIISTD